MKLYHAGSGDLVRTFEGHEDLVRTVAFDANVGVAVSGSYDKTIRVR
jgi:WD40 repeat protein